MRPIHTRKPSLCRDLARRTGTLFVIASGLEPALAAALDSGCGHAPPANGIHTMVHHGIVRTYSLRVPASYEATHPQRAVLAFHGWGGDEHEFLDAAEVVRESDRRGYILIVPRGVGSEEPDRRNSSWSFRGSTTGLIRTGTQTTAVCDATHTPDYTYPSCRRQVASNTCSWTQCQDDDVAFVGALLDHITSQLCIDTKHVYAAGGSNGGMFVWELGQNPAIAARLRAIAPIIGLPHRGDLRPPGKGGLLPVLLVTGIDDHTVPPGSWDDPAPTTTSDSDRFFYTGATAIIRRWSRAAGCGVSGRERPFDTGQAVADCRTYCDPADHSWPPVLDCRAPMAHDYGFAWSWNLVLDFFDRW